MKSIASACVCCSWTLGASLRCRDSTSTRTRRSGACFRWRLRSARALVAARQPAASAVPCEHVAGAVGRDAGVVVAARMPGDSGGAEVVREAQRDDSLLRPASASSARGSGDTVHGSRGRLHRAFRRRATSRSSVGARLRSTGTSWQHRRTASRARAPRASSRCRDASSVIPASLLTKNRTSRVKRSRGLWRLLHPARRRNGGHRQDEW